MKASARVAIALGLLFGCTPDPVAPDGGATATSTSAVTAEPTATDGTAEPVDTAGPAPTSTSGLPPVPPSPNRYISNIAWESTGKRMLVSCDATCTTKRVVAHEWVVGQRPVKTVELIPEMKADALRFVAWSERGTFSFASAGDKLFVVGPDGKPVTTIEALAMYDQFAVSPDEAKLAWADSYGQLYIVDMKTKAQTKAGSLHDPASSEPAVIDWAPTSDWFLVSAPGVRAPAIYDLKSKKLKTLTTTATWADMLPNGLVVVSGDDGTVALFDRNGQSKATLRKGRPLKEDEQPSFAHGIDRAKKKLVVAGKDLVVFDLEAKTSTTVVPKLDVVATTGVAITNDGAGVAVDEGDNIVVVDTKSTMAPPKVGAASLIGYGADGTLVVKSDSMALMGMKGTDAMWSIKLAEEPSAIVFDPSRELLAVAMAGRLRIIRVATGKNVVFELTSKDKDKTVELAPIGVTPKADVDAVLGPR